MRPKPPVELDEAKAPLLPSPELWQFIADNFLEYGGALYNPDHSHLQAATFGCYWAYVPKKKGGNRIFATAELGIPFGGDSWKIAKTNTLYLSSFGIVPDFILTFDAELSLEADDATFCAVVDHELYHCIERLNRWEEPMTDENGNQLWNLRGHDFEQFNGVVRRFGARAAGLETAMQLAMQPPLMTAQQILGACGT